MMSIADQVEALEEGYHRKPIAKGVLGELSKIREELEEAEDAASQGVRIMEVVELADLYGALRARVEKLGFTMADLEAMADVTARAFRNGHRV